MSILGSDETTGASITHSNAAKTTTQNNLAPCSPSNRWQYKKGSDLTTTMLIFGAFLRITKIAAKSQKNVRTRIEIQRFTFPDVEMMTKNHFSSVYTLFLPRKKSTQQYVKLCIFSFHPKNEREPKEIHEIWKTIK